MMRDGKFFAQVLLRGELKPCEQGKIHEYSAPKPISVYLNKNHVDATLFVLFEYKVIQCPINLKSNLQT